MRLDRTEAVVAGALTFAALALHLIAATSAGGMWRDEANTIGLASLPSLRDVWSNLQYDSFPMLWVFILRQFAKAFGLMNDAAFRGLGLTVGLLILSALWINARIFGHRYPLVALSFFALNPSVVRWGDSARAYGLGIAFAGITCALLWRYVTKPSRTTFAAAAVASVLAVQTLYYNAPVLLAFCAGSVVICAMNRDWKKAGSIVGIGLLAAITLLPYFTTVRAAGAWNSVVRIPDYDLSWFLSRLSDTLAPAGSWASAAWLGAVMLAVWAGIRETLHPNRLGLSKLQREAAVFALVSLVTGILAHFLFLSVLSYYTQPWYYLTLITTTAVCFDILAGALICGRTARVARIAAVIVIGFATMLAAAPRMGTRMTNADIVAHSLEVKARAGDLIVVTPWYVGVSFGRYYHGSAPWTMLPQLGFSRFHRYDLLLAAIREEDQTLPANQVILLAEQALQGGHSVFVVGDLPSSSFLRVPLSAARLDDEWRAVEYQDQWAQMLAEYLRAHAAGITRVPIGTGERISAYENLSLNVATGWR